MIVLKVLDIVCIVALIIFGADTMIKAKSMGEKTMEEVREPLIKRLSITMILTTVIALLTIIIVVLGARN